MPRRFYCPQSFERSPVTLGEAESNHLVRVLRLRVHDQIVLFDGNGLEAEAQIESLGPPAVVSILATRKAVTETSRPMILATAVPKGDRFDWLVEKAVELGAGRLVPLLTRRSIVHPGEGKLRRLRQVVVAASKQSGRSQLMELVDPVPWMEFVNRTLGDQSQLVIADPTGAPWSTVRVDERPLTICVGPEGGFTEDELAASRDATLVSLGPRILRIETAGLCLLTLAAASDLGR